MKTTVHSTIPAVPGGHAPRAGWLRSVFHPGIRQKIALVLLVTLLVALSVSGWLALQSQQREIMRETQMRGEELARFISLSLANSVVSYDYHAIEQWLQQTERQNEDIVYLRVVSDKGNTMAESGRAPDGARDLVLFTEAIRIDAQKVGEIVLGLSTQRITESFAQQKADLFKREFVVIALTLIVVFAALSAIIIRPIALFSRVMRTTRPLGHPGNENAVAVREPGGDDPALVATDLSQLPLESRDELGELARAFAHLQERTDLATEGLRASEARSRALIEAIPDLILRLRRDGTCLDAKIPRPLGAAYQESRLSGRHLTEALPTEVASLFLQHLKNALGGGGPAMFHYLQEIEDETRSFEARLTVSGDDEAVAIVRDTTEHKQLEERIRFLAHFDSLTNLPNRLLFKERVQGAMAKALAGNQLLAVMILDLDRFKIINDTLGHEAGDVLLQSVSERLLRCCRASDYVSRPSQQDATVVISRPGGDEFTLLINQLPDASDAGRAATRLLDALKAPFRVNGHEIVVSASIGIALCPGDGKDAETLIRNADAAMHHAKSEGRNQFQYYAPEMNTELSRRLKLEHRLRRALEGGELELHYQPQVEITTGRIVGAEVLLRWNSPELGPVSPTEFIPLAEDTGLVVPIGSWVLRTACEQARAWQNQGLPPLRLAVNISGVQFRHSGLAAEIADVLRKTGLAPQLLELEVTEGVILRNDTQVLRTFQDLKSLGVQLALDDFGTGYSSLSYLTRFPLDTLKIDRSFVRNIAGNQTEIASAIIAMAQSLKLQVIAEGVEERAQLAFLRAKGCEFVQGYLFSPPVPAKRMAGLLASGAFAQ